MKRSVAIFKTIELSKELNDLVDNIFDFGDHHQMQISDVLEMIDAKPEKYIHLLPEAENLLQEHGDFFLYFNK